MSCPSIRWSRRSVRRKESDLTSYDRHPNDLGVGQPDQGPKGFQGLVKGSYPGCWGGFSIPEYWYTTRMEITLNLPEDIAHGLEAKWKDLPRAALESLALEGYRSGALTMVQVRRLLGFGTRYELDGFLKRHALYLNYSIENLERDAEASRQFSSRR
jgi:hypothetical protein